MTDDLDTPASPDESADAADRTRTADDPAGSTDDEAPPREPRPVLERIGLAAIALLLALMFGGVAVASWFGGEPFLAVMGGIGCLMTVWVGTLTLLRG